MLFKLKHFLAVFVSGLVCRGALVDHMLNGITWTSNPTFNAYTPETNMYDNNINTHFEIYLNDVTGQDSYLRIDFGAPVPIKSILLMPWFVLREYSNPLSPDYTGYTYSHTGSDNWLASVAVGDGATPSDNLLLEPSVVYAEGVFHCDTTA